jgi:hypothetical protein
MLAIPPKPVCDAGHSSSAEPAQMFVNLTVARFHFFLQMEPQVDIQNASFHFSGQSMLHEFCGHSLIGGPSRRTQSPHGVKFDTTLCES